jgi:hypothetical protein
MDENRALDPERSELAELINVLVRCFGAAEFTAADVFDQAKKMGSNGQLVHPGLITVFSRDGRNVSAKTIGNQLMKRRDRVSRGCSIKVVRPGSAHHAVNKYRIDGAKEEQM